MYGSTYRVQVGAACKKSDAMATLAESFMADLDELSDVTEDEDDLQQADVDEEVGSVDCSSTFCEDSNDGEN